ncbi:hypothetical protein I6A84_35730 [Frankia sp. CNm7]|uniref:Uncharacterized protein n=1 Tax=Frankia nepalensis TaxID=1836974 RepID=A0A937RHG0_9ACTN|nr:hypothetical protein [Frankia nepalensis]MBL7499512.1 hypothetical protein [Frankia nepalensis]MBL7515501.1 hypothetical protein [Frankia nepalensis]MBL7523292.1 hypothetical protein [Frankia nepalensis]MBL7632283.1 hypothetical protein [Frankia nepalensis]
MPLGNAKPSFICDGCDRRGTGPITVSVTGRRLCPDCADRLTGAAAGAIATSDGGNAVGNAIATAGWFSALRARRRTRRPSDGDS